MSLGIEREPYRVTCLACGHRGRAEVTISEWGRVSARWSGFTEGRLARLKPQGGAKCGRCGSRDSVVADCRRQAEVSGAPGPPTGPLGRLGR